MERDVANAGAWLGEAIADHVAEAVALERDRLDAELGALRQEVTRLFELYAHTMRLLGVAGIANLDEARRAGDLWASALHSVKVDP
jgi:hypothetical protein